MAFSFVQRALAEREQENLLRRVKTVSQQHQGLVQIDGRFLINFASNDYLGLSQDQDVLQSYTEGLAAYGASSSASPVICGHHQTHQNLETRLADLTGQQSAMLFSSGFAANQAICQALAKPRPNHSTSMGIVFDKLMHASFVEAAMAYATAFYRFPHNCPERCEAYLLDEKCTDYLIASEGVFSMDGDCAPVNKLIKLKTQAKNTWLMLDQAHAIGVIGEEGCGLHEQKQYSSIDVVMGTFGKALGTQGAFIAGSSDLILYLQNFARHYVYSTALSPALAKATDTALTKMIETSYRTVLHENIVLFRALCNENEISICDSLSAIQPIVIRGNGSVVQAAECLGELGLLVGAIRSPTVPKHAERLRITLSALHTQKDIESLVDGLSILREKMGVSFGLVDQGMADQGKAKADFS
ncbi:MAG: 8-amino-7-oxononanoate synthase [Pseudomonadota bacterium]